MLSRPPEPDDGPVLFVVDTPRRATPMFLAVESEILHDGTWLELTAKRLSGKMVARWGMAIDDFGLPTLRAITDWLENEVARMDGRHIRLVREG